MKLSTSTKTFLHYIKNITFLIRHKNLSIELFRYQETSVHYKNILETKREIKCSLTINFYIISTSSGRINE